jgi:hypothetical protein
MTLRSLFTGLAVLLGLGACLQITPALADKRVALVIGNSAYVNVPRLTNPANDARLMADTLRKLGFTLVGGGAQVDLSKSGFESALQQFSDALNGADVALFYYAGHGVQVRGSNYLVPVGANPTRESDVDLQMLDSNVVLRQMEGAGTKLNLVILDACRNNPFGGRGLRATDAGLAQMRAPEGTLISFATQPGNVAQDGADGDSPYTKALAKTMLKPGVDVLRAFNEVGIAVADATGGAQQPWVSLSPIRGDFYFAGAPAAAAALHGVPSAAAPTADEIFWLTIKDSNVPALFDEFVKKFPSSAHAAEARARLEELKKVRVAIGTPPPTAPGSPSLTAKTYSKVGNFACFSNAEYPDSWREEASMCTPYGCNFGKMSEDACLTLGATKGSKTVIHGNTGTSRANECWLQHSCGDLRRHSEFTLFTTPPDSAIQTSDRSASDNTQISSVSASTPTAPSSPSLTAKTYSKVGNFACFGKAEYPDSWREEASMCTPYGCNFGKMSEGACLTLGATKGSKTVIHGNTGTSRANECWLQHSCGDLRRHSEFTLFKM